MNQGQIHKLNFFFFLVIRTLNLRRERTKQKMFTNLIKQIDQSLYLRQVN